VNGRRDGVRSEDGVGEFEESVVPTVEASVERVAEAVENIGRIHDVSIMHSLTALRTPYLPVELKRKLRRCADRRVANVTMDDREPIQLLGESPNMKRSEPIGASSKGKRKQLR
jgi:hypothetical protein